MLKNYYIRTFATLWSFFDELVAAGRLISVSEVLNELANYNEPDSIQDWAKHNKGIFRVPSTAEQLVVQDILAIPRFQPLIGGKAILKGTPVADPFVIAAAKVIDGTVVTEEAFRPDAAKIPNVCLHFGVPCVNLEKFMLDQGWTF